MTQILARFMQQALLYTSVLSGNSVFPLQLTRTARRGHDAQGARGSFP